MVAADGDDSAVTNCPVLVNNVVGDAATDIYEHRPGLLLLFVQNDLC